MACKESPTVNTDNLVTQQPCQEQYMYSIDTFLIENFLFKTGSYWVYLDSLNNTYDSSYSIVRVKMDSTFYTFSDTPGIGSCPYLVRYAYNNNSISRYQYNFYLQGDNFNLGTPFGEGSIVLTTSKNGLLYPSFGNNKTNYSTYYINNIPYTYVMEFSMKTNYGDGISYPDSGHYFLKEGVGIIRTDLFFWGKKRTYKLVHYHIN